MTLRIMEGAGVGTDMVSGRPGADFAQIKKQAAVKKATEVFQEASDLRDELSGGSPIVQVLMERYRDRLLVLASQDAECKSLDAIIGSIRHKIEVAPARAEAHIRQVLGPELISFLKDKPQEE